ncbi:MAG: hypothetical protein ACLPKW_26935 [Acetobacteraceae bacterium]
MTDVLNRVNQTKLAAELLGDAAEMHAGLPADDRSSFEGRAISLFKMLDRRGLGRKRADLAIADISFRGRRYRRATYDVSRDEHGGWTAIDRLTGRENYGVTREAAIGALARLEYDLWQAEGRKRLGVRGLLSRWGRR